MRFGLIKNTIIFILSIKSANILYEFSILPFLGPLSDTAMEDLILSTYLLFVALIVAIDWAIKNYKKSIKTKYDFRRESVESLGNYTFVFDHKELVFNGTLKQKKVSIGTKVVLGSLSLVIVLVPLYEFITTLEPVTEFYFMNCLG